MVEEFVYCLQQYKYRSLRVRMNVLKTSLDVQSGYVDKFGNIWQKAKGNSPQGPIHWDVQLSQAGKHQLKHMSNSGAHLNVTSHGQIHH